MALLQQRRAAPTNLHQLITFEKREESEFKGAQTARYEHVVSSLIVAIIIGSALYLSSYSRYWENVHHGPFQVDGSPPLHWLQNYTLGTSLVRKKGQPADLEYVQIAVEGAQMKRFSSTIKSDQVEYGWLGQEVSLHAQYLELDIPEPKVLSTDELPHKMKNLVVRFPDTRVGYKSSTHFGEKWPFDFSVMPISTLKCIAQTVGKKANDMLANIKDNTNSSEFVAIAEQAQDTVNTVGPKGNRAFNKKVATECGVIIGFLTDWPEDLRWTIKQNREYLHFMLDASQNYEDNFSLYTPIIIFGYFVVKSIVYALFWLWHSYLTRTLRVLPISHETMLQAVVRSERLTSTKEGSFWIEKHVAGLRADNCIYHDDTRFLCISDKFVVAIFGTPRPSLSANRTMVCVRTESIAMVDDTGMWSANDFGRADLLVRWSNLDRTKDESSSASNLQDWTMAAMERVHGSTFLQRQANTKKKTDEQLRRMALQDSIKNVVYKNIQRKEISDQFGDQNYFGGMSGSSFEKNIVRGDADYQLASRLAKILSQACTADTLAATLNSVDDIASPASLEHFVADVLPAKHSKYEVGVRLGGEIAKMWLARGLVMEEEDEDASFMLSRAKSAKVKTMAAQDTMEEFAASLIPSENSTNYRPADKMVRAELRQSAKLCQDGQAPFGGDMCTICACDFDVNDSVIKWKGCAHWFHEDCVLPWLRTRNTCPNCRQEVAADESAIGKVRDAHQARHTRWLHRVFIM
jgi:hypothetical protein